MAGKAGKATYTAATYSTKVNGCTDMVKMATIMPVIFRFLNVILCVFFKQTSSPVNK